MLKVAPGRPGNGSVGSSIGDTVERTTCFTSSALSGPASLPACTASRPAAMTSAATPAWVGVPVDVEPSLLGTLKSACGPKEVSVERLRYVRFASTLGDCWPRVDWSPTIEFPGQMCG